MGLPLTKMIEFSPDIDIVRDAIASHCAHNDNHSLSDYHISEWGCDDWSNESSALPYKIKHISY